MKGEDIEPALEIIRDFDEDDYDCACETFENPANSSLYVLATDDAVIGVTGFVPADETDNSYWLEWTYLATRYRKQGLGRQMLEELFVFLRKTECRKLFVSLSDYQDPEDGPIYEDALHLYKAMGFYEEQILNDFYAPGESRLTWSLVFKPVNPFTKVGKDERAINLHGIFEISETDDAYAVDWEFSSSSSSTGRDMEELIVEAKSLGARTLFITFPSDVPSTGDALKSLGFVACGRLIDYFAEAVHEQHYRYDF